MAVGDDLAELSEAEFQATFSEPVVPVELEPERRAEMENAAAAVLASRSPGIAPGAFTLANSYELGGGACFHHLVWYGLPNIYLVLVADARQLRSFHRLDLNAEYGLPPFPDPFWPPS